MIYTGEEADQFIAYVSAVVERDIDPLINRLDAMEVQVAELKKLADERNKAEHARRMKIIERVKHEKRLETLANIRVSQAEEAKAATIARLIADSHARNRAKDFGLPVVHFE